MRGLFTDEYEEEDAIKLGVTEPDVEAGVPPIGLLLDRIPVLVRARAGGDGVVEESLIWIKKHGSVMINAEQGH